MHNITFQLNKQEFIQLDQIMKLLNLVECGSDAHEAIDAGHVKVDGVTEYRRRRKLRYGSIIEFEKNKITIQ